MDSVLAIDALVTLLDGLKKSANLDHGSLANIVRSMYEDFDIDDSDEENANCCTGEKCKSSCLFKELSSAQQCFVVTGGREEGYPITYVSDDFVKLTGYPVEEILGVNCRFLTGPETSKETIQIIKHGLETEQDITVCLLNYRKNGEKFWNQLFISPLRDSEGKAIRYLGVQSEVSEKYAKNFAKRRVNKWSDI